MVLSLPWMLQVKLNISHPRPLYAKVQQRKVIAPRGLLKYP